MITSGRMQTHLRVSPQIGTRTPVLGNDGSDLAAAIETIQEIGDSNALDTAVSDAFHGNRL